MSKTEAFEDLKRRILTLQLAPGEALDEVSLSEEYALSRTPLRDVLRQLAGEGFVTIVNNRGASVAAMDYTTLRQFFLSAPMIYAAIGRLAAENATPEQIADMTAAQNAFRQAAKSGDSKGLTYWNNQFHRIMGEMAHNPYLLPSYQRLLFDHARISQTFYNTREANFDHNLEEASAQHDAMIECIKAHDGSGMVDLIQAHWELSRTNMTRYVHPEPLQVEKFAAKAS